MLYHRNVSESNWSAERCRMNFKVWDKLGCNSIPNVPLKFTFCWQLMYCFVGLGLRWVHSTLLIWFHPSHPMMKMWRVGSVTLRVHTETMRDTVTTRSVTRWVLCLGKSGQQGIGKWPLPQKPLFKDLGWKLLCPIISHIEIIIGKSIFMPGAVRSLIHGDMVLHSIFISYPGGSGSGPALPGVRTTTYHA